MHVYYIMIKSSQKFWVAHVRYRFIPEQCGTQIKENRNTTLRKLFNPLWQVRQVDAGLGRWQHAFCVFSWLALFMARTSLSPRWSLML